MNSKESLRASQEATMMLSLAPTVPHMPDLSFDSICTRVTASAPSWLSIILTLKSVRAISFICGYLSPRAFLKALSSAETGPAASATVCSISPFISSFTVASERVMRAASSRSPSRRPSKASKFRAS